MLTVEQRLTRLEGQSKDPVSSALQDLHKTLDRTKFDHEDAILDLEALVKCEYVFRKHFPIVRYSGSKKKNKAL